MSSTLYTLTKSSIFWSFSHPLIHPHWFPHSLPPLVCAFALQSLSLNSLWPVAGFYSRPPSRQILSYKNKLFISQWLSILLSLSACWEVKSPTCKIYISGIYLEYQHLRTTILGRACRKKTSTLLNMLHELRRGGKHWLTAKCFLYQMAYSRCVYQPRTITLKVQEQTTSSPFVYAQACTGNTEEAEELFLLYFKNINVKCLF